MISGQSSQEVSMKLVKLTDEGDKPIIVNADAICFFERAAPDRVEIRFVGGTNTVVRGTVDFVRMSVEGLSGADGRANECVIARKERVACEN